MRVFYAVEEQLAHMEVDDNVIEAPKRKRSRIYRKPIVIGTKWD